MANSAITKPKRLIVSSIEDGPTEYDREKCHAHLIEQYKLYVRWSTGGAAGGCWSTTLSSRCRRHRVRGGTALIYTLLVWRSRTTRRASAPE